MHVNRRRRFPEQERDYFLERMYPTYGNMTPRDVASRRARELCNAGHGVLAQGGVRSISTSRHAIKARDGAEAPSPPATETLMDDVRADHR